jgi:hypothetical protein
MNPQIKINGFDVKMESPLGQEFMLAIQEPDIISKFDMEVSHTH